MESTQEGKGRQSSFVFVDWKRLPRCTLQLWDTAGMERFSGLGQSFYR